MSTLSLIARSVRAFPGCVRAVQHVVSTALLDRGAALPAGASASVGASHNDMPQVIGSNSCAHCRSTRSSMFRSAVRAHVSWSVLLMTAILFFCLYAGYPNGSDIFGRAVNHA